MATVTLNSGADDADALLMATALPAALPRPVAKRRSVAPALPVYSGPFGEAQAERLLWRAGFGPRRGEAQALAAKGLRGAVLSLTRPPRARLEGPAPVDSKGRPIAPGDAWGHDHLWWLDRMVRTNQPLVERMALNWHDWFATGDVGATRLNLAQNSLMRRRALGSFATLLSDLTRDPAMLLWLSGTENSKDAPNENYAREMMELFTLGAARGYTEDDVRQMARALTGYTNDWSDSVGPHRFRYEARGHDAGVKRIFGKRGKFDWRDACRLCLENRAHPSYFVGKLWSYFVPTPPAARTVSSLSSLYVRGSYEVRPVVEAILMHPDLHEGPRLVKPAIVYVAGLLRTRGRPLTTESWTWLSHLSGQMLFQPPNVAGWDEARWLDTATICGRWKAANTSLQDQEIETDDASYDITETPEAAVSSAIAFWGGPVITPETRGRLLAFSQRCADGIEHRWQERSYRVLRQNALRMLVATSPDFQTC